MSTDRIDVEAAVVLLRTLANPARLRIMLRLLDGECGVATLESELGLRQPNLSQHLAELRDAGLVASRRESRAVFYTLADEAQRRLITSLLQGLGGAPPPVPVAATAPRRRQGAAVFARIGATWP